MENFFEVKNTSPVIKLSELQLVNKKIEEFKSAKDKISSMSEDDKVKLISDMYTYHDELENNLDPEISKQASTLMAIIDELDPIIIGEELEK